MTSPPNSEVGGPPLVCPPLLPMQYILSYLSYLEVLSFIHNLRKRDQIKKKQAQSQNADVLNTLVYTYARALLK